MWRTLICIWRFPRLLCVFENWEPSPSPLSQLFWARWFWEHETACVGSALSDGGRSRSSLRGLAQSASCTETPYGRSFILECNPPKPKDVNSFKQISARVSWPQVLLPIVISLLVLPSTENPNSPDSELIPMQVLTTYLHVTFSFLFFFSVLFLFFPGSSYHFFLALPHCGLHPCWLYSYN